jgi:CHASE3 domain sensor protein
MQTHAELLGASQRELRLYQELLATYQDLTVLLTEEQAALDPNRLTSFGDRAEMITAELRALRDVLAPYRMSGEVVSAEIQALWRGSAALAAEAAGANARMVNHARARQAEITAKFQDLARGRRVLAAYRPADSPGLSRRQA